jgi:hypothetical protein
MNYSLMLRSQDHGTLNVGHIGMHAQNSPLPQQLLKGKFQSSSGCTDVEFEVFDDAVTVPPDKSNCGFRDGLAPGRLSSCMGIVAQQTASPLTLPLGSINAAIPCGLR